jgi:hypothetical protein
MSRYGVGTRVYKHPGFSQSAYAFTLISLAKCPLELALRVYISNLRA